MYSIGGNFSAAGIEFYWPTPKGGSKILEITINKLDGPPKITSDNLKEKDKQWLIINSPTDWRINLIRLKERFELQNDKRMPDDDNPILFIPTDLGDQLRIQIDLWMLYGV